MTLADPPGHVFEADSPLARLDVGPELPGQDGSGGIVLPATDDGRRLALKVVRGRLFADPEARERARADALAQHAIEHPRIATLVESGKGPDGFYLLMSWLEGRSLDAVLRDGPMDPWDLVPVVADVADAVEAAATAGVVHRDLTPAKIVVGPDGHASLGDLGAGRRRAGDPLPPASLDHVAPETIRGDAPTPATLEYALACIAFHALTGRAPFARARLSVKTFWHVRAPRPLVSETRPGLPQPVDAVIARAMAIDPADRHGSPTGFVQALSAALGPRPEAAAPAEVPARLPRPRRARPVPAATPAVAERETAPVSARMDWLQDAGGPGRMAWIAGGLAALAVAGAALGGGLLAGRATQEPAPDAAPGVVGTSALAIARPAGWRELDPGPAVPGIEAGEDVAVAPASDDDAAIVAGLAEAGRDGLLPDALVEALRDPPGTGEPVRLGELEAVRYARLEDRRGEAMRLYAVPTTGGTALVACLGAAADEAAATCDQQAATLQLTDARAASVDPAPAYGKAVQRAFAALRRQRDRGLDALAGARRRPGQAAAAGGLAGAYATAAEALREAPDQRFVRERNRAIVAALARTASAYRALSAAARRGDEAAYGSARTSVIAAERAVDRAVRQLGDAGYRVR